MMSHALQAQQQLPVLRHADGFSVISGIEYYQPAPGFDRRDRDIDVALAQAALGAHFRDGWEFQVNGLFLRAHGTAVLSPTSPPVPSNTVSVGAGPLFRWNALEFGRFRIFVDGQADLILNHKQFPAGGTGYDFFLRGGGGLSGRLSSRYWLEASYRGAHISNAQGIGGSNPSWNGRGLAFGLRRTLGSPAETSAKPVSPDEEQPNAWITAYESYWPITSENPRSIAVQIHLLRISRAWQLPKRLEVQAGGLVATPAGNNVFGFGPLLRWNGAQSRKYRLYVNGGADLLQVGSPAYVVPVGGVGYNIFSRVGGGAAIHLHASYWLEGGYQWGHVTSGFGPGNNNRPWSGQGLSIGFRHTFSRSFGK